MATSITEYFDIDKDVFEVTGAFDAVLDVDTPLFVDPALLRDVQVPEFSGSHARLKKRFGNIIKLLSNSQKRRDVFWKEAAKLLTFPELEGLCIGYSKKGTAGSGMGPGLRNELLGIAKQIIDAGIKDPELFELIGLFQDGIGADRVGDMTARIIVEDIVRYSTRVFSDLGVKGKKVSMHRQTIELPTNPFNGKPVLLVPIELLRDLPVAHDWSDIGHVVAENERLRGRLNAIVGAEWKKTSKPPKALLREVFLGDPDALKSLIKAYKAAEAKPYPYLLDPKGVHLWRTRAKEAAAAHPLMLALPATPSIDDLEAVVMVVCKKFQELVENNGLSRLFYVAGKARNESFIQLLFYAIADSYCEANDIDLTAESDAGRGPVDFKFSKGYSLRILVEVKKSTSSKLSPGYKKQLPTYLKAEKTRRGIYLVVDTGASEKTLENIRKQFLANPKGPRLVIVDGMEYPSASKL